MTKHLGADLEAAQTIYQNLVLRDLARDFRIGFNLAFYRTYAIPRIAELLTSTGQIQRQPHKRSIDTGLFMYELIHAGFDSERGQHVIAALNKMHHRWQIRDEDYRYVLTTFIIVPTRWIDSYGPRKLTPGERTATTLFYRELGEQMKIPDPADTYEAAEAYFDDYEHRNLGYSAAGNQLMQATRTVMAEQLPLPLKPLASTMTRLILHDDLARAVGLRPAPKLGRHLMTLLGRTRRALNRLRRPRKESWFVPGRTGKSVYPHGYRIDDLGTPPD